MTSGSNPDDDLRRSAESRLNDTPQPASPPQAAVETLRLVHELQVHQIELELQNEELRTSRALREALLARYTELYDFAPVGYFTLARDGTILQTNLLGASLLGVERSNLQGRRFGLFVDTGQRPCLKLFLEQVFTGQPRQPCELQLGSEAGPPLVVDMKATLAADSQTCHAVAVDITARKLADAALRISEERLAMALAGSELGLWDWELKSDRLVCDGRWPATLGYAADELPADLSDWKQRLHPDDFAVTMAALAAHLNGDTGEYESEHRVHVSRYQSQQAPGARIVRPVSENRRPSARRGTGFKARRVLRHSVAGQAERRAQSPAETNPQAHRRGGHVGRHCREAEDCSADGGLAPTRADAQAGSAQRRGSDPLRDPGAAARRLSTPPRPTAAQ